MNNQELEELMKQEDWELRAVLLHKKDPIGFPMNLETAKKTCEEILADCASGEVLGQGWHGGMTQEEWKARREYIERVLKEIETL